MHSTSVLSSLYVEFACLHTFYGVCQPPTNPVVLQMPNSIWGSSYHDILGALEYFSIFEINLTGRRRYAAKHWNNNKKI